MSASLTRVALAAVIVAIGTDASMSVAADARPAADAPPAAIASQCLKAKRNVAKEEKWEAKGRATIERARKDRATCATGPVCGRYDERIKALETRKVHHDARLARFNADATRACAHP